MNTPSYQAMTLSPILPVSDMSVTCRFYREVLGFDAAMESEAYSILRKDGATLHLTQAADESVVQRTRGNMSIYLEVADIQALWSHVSSYRDRYTIRDLFDRDYGMREFHILDPDGCLIFVGQQIPGTPS